MSLYINSTKSPSLKLRKTFGLRGYIPIHTSFENPSNPMSFVSFFDHLAIPQLWIGNKFGPSRSTPFPCPRISLKDTVSILEGFPISIETVAYPHGPVTIFNPSLGLSNEGFSQRRYSVALRRIQGSVASILKEIIILLSIP